ncbi:hypothetical protein KBI52_20935 [Microvirga sp. HBU67558]|uniref:hypothetical protein n=1 Tax=Microvirga TaxID=186650 RepID=UPI001B3844CE|nr:MULTISPECIES: hypothetical protein [unclassified Microvirga]MBQ0822655.1 hypothetical protein [Microvirga sp. HBU67558]
MPRAVYAEWDEDDVTDWVDERPSRRLRRKSLPWLRMVLISTCTIAGLVYVALEQEQNVTPAERRRAVPSSVLVAPAPAWKALPSSPSVYALAGISGPVVSEAREHADGAREDTLTVGRFGDFRYAQLALVQGPAESPGSFYIDTVRRAARSGLAVAHLGQSRMIATKFGSMEAAPMTLANKGEQSCLAFRFSDPAAMFGFQGWLCGSTAPDDGPLACFIDGIALTGSSNPSLKAVFAQAERGRADPCGPGARTAPGAVRPPARP